MIVRAIVIPPPPSGTASAGAGEPHLYHCSDLDVLDVLNILGVVNVLIGGSVVGLVTVGLGIALVAGTAVRGRAGFRRRARRTARGARLRCGRGSLVRQRNPLTSTQRSADPQRNR